MPAVAISSSVDTSSITRAIDLASKNTSRRMELLLADTAFYTAVEWYNQMPFVEISTIDSSLNEVVHTSSPKTKFGKQNNLGGLPWTRGMNIALARTNPNSPYSKATGNRWPLFYPGGLRGAARWRFFVNASDRMITSRHSSTHFLAAGVKAIVQAIAALGFRKPGGAQLNHSGSHLIKESSELGSASYSGKGSALQMLTISNLVGTDSGAGGNATLSAEHNAAMIAFGTPALQYALNKQAERMRDWNLNKDIEAEIIAEWNSIPNAPAYVKGSRQSSVRAAEDAGPVELETFG